MFYSISYQKQKQRHDTTRNLGRNFKVAQEIKNLFKLQSYE